MKFCALILSISLATAQIYAAEAAKESRIIYTANRQGEIADCGCQSHQVGGLERFANFVDTERKSAIGSPPLILDSGDSFFPTETVNLLQNEEGVLKAKLIARAYRIIGIDAMTIGERDLAAGIEVLRQLEEISGVPIVVTNLTDNKGERPFKRAISIERGGTRYLILGFIDPKLIKPEMGLIASSPADSLREFIKEKSAGEKQTVIILSHLGLSADKELAALKDGLLVFGAHSMDVLSSPLRVGKSAVFQPLNQGQQAGVLRWESTKQEVIQHELIEMDSRYDRKNEITGLIKEHNEKRRSKTVAKENKKKEKKRLTSGAYVAQPQVCKNCHSEQHAFWKNTMHASAILVLYSKNQHFDPECIGCHTLGFGDPRGFKKITRPIEITSGETAAEKLETSEPFVEQLLKRVFSGEIKQGMEMKALDSRKEPKRFEALRKRYHDEIDELEKNGRIKNNYLGVQCEHCHGNRQGHPGVKWKPRPVSLSTCKECHRPPNVTGFSSSLLAKIACPLMVK